MDKADERFLEFWSKWKHRKWAFYLTFGGVFGVFVWIVFAIRSVYFKGHIDGWPGYFQSDLIWMHPLMLVLIGGLIYGWLMRRYCIKTEEKIKAKYNE